jgi:hypothetical protein
MSSEEATLAQTNTVESTLETLDDYLNARLTISASTSVTTDHGKHSKHIELKEIKGEEHTMIMKEAVARFNDKPKVD